MRALLMPVGSHGDVLPLLGLGQALQNHAGWKATALVSPVFSKAARAAGIDHRTIGTVEDYQQAENDPDLHHPQRGVKAVSRVLGQFMRHSYDALASELDSSSEPAVLIGTTLAFPVRILQEQRKLPAVMVHLSPAVFRSNLKPPILTPNGPLPGWLPSWALRLFWWLADRMMIDPLLGKAHNQLRRQLGLRPVYRIMDRWMHQVDLSLGLFPEWYFRAPDWPPNLRQTEFPMYDRDDVHELNADLESWLEQGEPPVIITGGSAFANRKSFYEDCLRAAQTLGRRALVVTRHRSNVPEGSRWVEYAPFSLLLPRGAALIHHGGIGTVAQSLACGIPQLVVPQAHDQFDNAYRVEQLGAGVWSRGKLTQDLARVLSQRRCAYPIHSGLHQAARLISELASLQPGSGCA
ncbi:glycosyltransferase family 1 protein [bacterium]|nr:glycosyltransferase family 1 protein [bacterium]